MGNRTCRLVKQNETDAFRWSLVFWPPLLIRNHVTELFSGTPFSETFWKMILPYGKLEIMQGTGSYRWFFFKKKHQDEKGLSIRKVSRSRTEQYPVLNSSGVHPRIVCMELNFSFMKFGTIHRWFSSCCLDKIPDWCLKSQISCKSLKTQVFVDHPFTSCLRTRLTLMVTCLSS